MSYGPEGPGKFPALSEEAIEAQRPERTRPVMPKFDTDKERNIWLGSLPRGQSRVIADIVCVPTGKKEAKGRRPYHAKRCVDRRIWDKLNGPARGRYIETIRAEIGA